jgi:hypothetical protein
VRRASWISLTASVKTSDLCVQGITGFYNKVTCFFSEGSHAKNVKGTSSGRGVVQGLLFHIIIKKSRHFGVGGGHGRRERLGGWTGDCRIRPATEGRGGGSALSGRRRLPLRSGERRGGVRANRFGGPAAPRQLERAGARGGFRCGNWVSAGFMGMPPTDAASGARGADRWTERWPLTP